MKEEILSQLKAKFVGATDSFYDRVATIMAKTVTKQEDIEPAIAASEDWIAAFKVEGDKRATEAVKTAEARLKAEIEAAKAKEGGDKTIKAEPTNDTPEWAKAIIESNKALADKVAAYDSERNAKSHLEKLTGKLEERGIPKNYYSPIIDNRSFKDDAELDSYVEKIEANHKALLQDLSDKGLAAQPKPTFGAADKDGVSPSVREYIAEKTVSAATDNGLGGKKL